MATISVAANLSLRPWRGGRSRGVHHFPETATQVFAVNDVLTYDTAGGKQNEVKLASTASPCTTNPIIGVAAEAASGTEGNKVAVWPAEEESEWIGCIDAGTALTAAMVNSQFGVVWDGTGKLWRVNTQDTTNKRVVITELYDAVGDINGRVIFKWLNASRAPFAS